MKSLISIIIAAALIYIGYLVWTNLSEQERSQAVRKVDQAAQKAADTVTPVVKDWLTPPEGEDSKPAPETNR
nr:hypothetical protein [Gammaproteobacteria bacterium]